MKQNDIRQRIAALRDYMRREGLAAFIIPSNDPHQSEYVAPHWEARKWISGFTGSAGTVVVTLDEAGLWTDSRYFLQAADQLQGSGIGLYKEGLPGTPSIAQFLKERLKPGECVGVDDSVFSAAQARMLGEELRGGPEVYVVDDPWDELWPGRPAMPRSPILIYPLQYAGQSCADKLAAIRRDMAEEGADMLLVSALDEIAWTMNLRAADVHCNPVVVSYLAVEHNTAHFFVETQRVTGELAAYLSANSICTHPYNELGTFLKSARGRVQTDLKKTNCMAHAALQQSGATLVDRPSPIALLKAVRNETEQKGLREAMLRDGIALAKFLKWLDEAVPAGGQTEMSVAEKLRKLRAEQPLFMGESFDTIAGYKEHAAIVHYEATPETDAALRPEGFLLLDSGAQYLDGTTDITRTIALGPLTDEEKLDYTLVLKGHIALARAVFPEGTRGAQLDALARIPLWTHRMNFLHGTGHGVGHFLNVHEGPQSIRMNENPVPIRAGMLTSNEPGVYKAGSHGIRTENLLLAVPAGEGMFGGYLQFDTVTLCPICKKGIVKELLTQEEREWLDSYHRHVYSLIAPHLDADEEAWLREACRAL